MGWRMMFRPQQVGAHPNLKTKLNKGGIMARLSQNGAAFARPHCRFLRREL
jgi:hypothetical protein